MPDPGAARNLKEPPWRRSSTSVTSMLSFLSVGLLSAAVLQSAVGQRCGPCTVFRTFVESGDTVQARLTALRYVRELQWDPADRAELLDSEPGLVTLLKDGRLLRIAVREDGTPRMSDTNPRTVSVRVSPGARLT